MQVDLGFSRELYELLARETRNEIEGRGEMQMREGQDGTQWEHVHKCPQCDYVIKSDEMSHSATAIGIITCPKCDYSGPINLQIVPENSGSC
jgi:predicted RNA-binding Zn-ribbon protein involved in translation (DUF1610 family)